MWCGTSKGCSALLWSGLLSGVSVLTGLSSSEWLNIKQQCTGLQLLNLLGECSMCCSAVVSGMLGSKDKFSLVEMWYIHGVLLRGVDIFKLSLPLLYPLSSCVNTCSKTSFKVIMRWPNIISLSWFHSCCTELLQKKAV